MVSKTRTRGITSLHIPLLVGCLRHLTYNTVKLMSARMKRKLRTPERMKVSVLELNPGEQRVRVSWQPSRTLAQPVYQAVPDKRDSLCISFYTFGWLVFGRVWFSLWGRGCSLCSRSETFFSLTLMLGCFQKGLLGWSLQNPTKFLEPILQSQSWGAE